MNRRLSAKAIKMSTFSHTALLGLALSWTTLLCAQEHGPAHWGYKGEAGPSHWGDLSSEFAACKTGHSQAPVDIRHAQKADLPPIQFDYKASPLQIIDNGHTVMVNYAPGSSIQVGDKRYALQQFHFHKPSEEKIEGKSSDMAVHLVHADQDGNLAVVAVLLKKGAANALIGQLWSHLPQEKGKEESPESIQVNATDLLPESRAYYTFQGSLTTPPCSENVTWFVLKHPSTISATEIRDFGRLYNDNARPIQALNNRAVLESK
jgi:carbonic anhydrase